MATSSKKSAEKPATPASGNTQISEDQRAGRTPLLTISTLAPERPVAVIDDQPHEFRLMQEFGAEEHQEWTRDSRRYDELWNRDKRLSKPEAVMMERLLDRLFAQAMLDPDAIREQLGDRLSGAIKRELVVTFSNAPLLMQAMAQNGRPDEADEEATDSPSTTES